jgi:hypothetical protein
MATAKAGASTTVKNRNIVSSLFRELSESAVAIAIPLTGVQGLSNHSDYRHIRQLENRLFLPSGEFRFAPLATSGSRIIKSL